MCVLLNQRARFVNDHYLTSPKKKQKTEWTFRFEMSDLSPSALVIYSIISTMTRLCRCFSDLIKQNLINRWNWFGFSGNRNYWKKKVVENVGKKSFSGSEQLFSFWTYVEFSVQIRFLFTFEKSRYFKKNFQNVWSMFSSVLKGFKTAVKTKINYSEFYRHYSTKCCYPDEIMQMLNCTT